jgi:hypothetical protein
MKITLCGSTRFMDRYHAANRQLTLMGHVVYSVATISTGAAASQHTAVGEEVSDDDKVVLDLVHLRKIQESDAIVVIGWNKDADTPNYIGPSTRREIMWATMLGKPVYAEDEIAREISANSPRAAHGWYCGRHGT